MLGENVSLEILNLSLPKREPLELLEFSMFPYCVVNKCKNKKCRQQIHMYSEKICITVVVAMILQFKFI